MDTMKDWKSQGCPPVLESSGPTCFRSVLNVDLHLFSAALYGTSFSGIAALVHEIAPARWLFEAALKMWSPSYKQLKPESKELRNLAAVTTQLCVEHSFSALRARIYYADGDGIIEDLVYPTDPAPLYLKNQTHASVCKPRAEYTEPVDLIRNALIRTNPAAFSFSQFQESIFSSELLPDNMLLC